MITLNEIVSSNLNLLKEQEDSLLQSLNLIRQARELFESQDGFSVPGVKKRGRRSKRISSITRPRKLKRTSRKRTGGTHMERIKAVLQEKKAPISSGELLEELFKKQKANKDKKHFGTLIYPVLTKAYRSGELKLKKGKIHVPA